MKAAKPTDDVKQTEDYQNMVNLLAVYSEADNRLKELQTQSTRDYLESVDEHKPEYAKLQETLTTAERALEVIALQHPNWFETRKSIKTPYGTVKFTRTSKLEVANREVSILLLENRAKADPEFTLSTYTRKETVLDLEALGKLSDAALAEFRIKRVREESFSVLPAVMDMGKAVKESTAKAVAE